MSFPTKDTIYGTIIYDNKKYELLNNPLNESLYHKIIQYKDDNNCGISTAPWSVNNFEWLIEDNKIYLISVKLKLCEKKGNIIFDIFNTNKLFASWLNDKIKLLISKKKIETMKNGKIKMQRDILILKFSEGIVTNARKKTEDYQTLNLKYYIDEE